MLPIGDMISGFLSGLAKILKTIFGLSTPVEETVIDEDSPESLKPDEDEILDDLGLSNNDDRVQDKSGSNS